MSKYSGYAAHSDEVVLRGDAGSREFMAFEATRWRQTRT
jgi:hypothetical protein